LQHGEVIYFLNIDLPKTKKQLSKPKPHSTPSSMCYRPTITRKNIIKADLPSRTKIRTHLSNLTKTFLNHFNGMKSKPDFLRDKSNSSSINNKKNWSSEFSKKSSITPEASQFLQNHSLKKKPLSTNLFLLTQLIAN